MLRVVKRWTGKKVGRQVGDRGKPVVHWGSHRLPTQPEEIGSWKPPPRHHHHHYPACWALRAQCLAHSGRSAVMLLKWTSVRSLSQARGRGE